MRKWIFWMLALAAALAAVTTTGSRSHAGIIGGPLGLHEAADDLRLAETVQFRWRGHRYCW
ncbi:23S rRNA pseudoU1915 N3-methylase RlmH [Bradyrhizobium sp. USDA 4459]